MYKKKPSQRPACSLCACFCFPHPVFQSFKYAATCVSCKDIRYLRTDELEIWRTDTPEISSTDEFEVSQIHLRFQAQIHRASPLTWGGAWDLCSSACSTAHPCSAALAPPCTASAADAHLSFGLHHHCGFLALGHLWSKQVWVLATDKSKSSLCRQNALWSWSSWCTCEPCSAPPLCICDPSTPKQAGLGLSHWWTVAVSLCVQNVVWSLSSWYTYDPGSAAVTCCLAV